MPLKSEINPLPLMKVLAGAGAKLALPAIAGRGKPLIMRAYAFGDEFMRGQWGIREPRPEQPEVFPDVLLVPLACFDRAGQRIGYGAGYYDMTIRRLRATKKVVAIGMAFAVQEIATVPATDRDERLDLVLTETGTIDFRGH
jgi:5-formyltetrahydrofolate cyclo-ligase